MKQLEDLGYNSPPPEGFAVWRVTPTAYDPAAADGACGGTLYECGPSPPMIAIDPDCGCWAGNPDCGCCICLAKGEMFAEGCC